MNITGTAYLNYDGDAWEHELASVTVEVQRTDENEVRLGVLLRRASDSDDNTIYLSIIGEPSWLAHMLGIAVLANEAAAHGAASFATREQ